MSEMAQFRRRRPRKFEVLRVRKNFPIGPEYPRFNPWTDEQEARLREMYEQDLAVLEGMASLWKPDAPAAAPA